MATLPEGQSFRQYVEATGTTGQDAIAGWCEHASARQASIAGLLGVDVEELHSMGPNTIEQRIISLGETNS